MICLLTPSCDAFYLLSSKISLISSHSTKVTIFAPINRAFVNHKLTVKSSGEDRNSARHFFILSHIISDGYSVASEDGYFQTLKEGRVIRVEHVDGNIVIDGRAKVVGKIEGVNGVIYKIDNVLVD